VAQQMRADVLLQRLQAGPPERILQHGVYDLGILEGPMVRRPRRYEQRTGVAGSSVSDVIHDRFRPRPREAACGRAVCLCRG